MTSTKIRRRVRDSILQSLAAGVVPRTGQQHIQVGRADEVRALLQDIQRINEGGSTVRFVIGEYGSGKTFFLSLIRSVAMSEKLVTAHADLSPDRRLQARGGQGRSLYQELMRNVATRSKPEGGALGSVVEKFITTALTAAREQDRDAEEIIRQRLESLSESVGGYDFAEVIAAYWRGHDTGNDELKASAVRWLRGEYTTKTDARKALGVRTIVDDSNVYDMLKLLARFTHLAGFSGLMVCLDELVNLYKLSSGQARKTNYEQLLRILNDSLQGTSQNLGFLLGGTPEFLLDTRKGLYSYEALQTRLAQNPFAKNGLVDLSGPVLRLANLSPEDIYVLLQKIRHVHAGGVPTKYALPDEALQAFMLHCNEKIGEAYFRTPRNTVVAFVQILAVLEQNPDVDWTDLISQVSLQEEENPDLQPLGDTASAEDDELATFKL